MDDLISRQAAIETIMGQPPEPHYPSWYAAQIEKLPSAQPERKRGKWIVWDEIIAGIYHTVSECSECGFTTDKMYREEMRYCPTCGADMRGEQDG